MTIPIDDLTTDVRKILEDALENFKEDFTDLLPDLEGLAKRAAEYGLKAAQGDKDAKICLEELRQQAGLLAAIITWRGEQVIAIRLEQGIDLLAKFLALVLKRML